MPVATTSVRTLFLALALLTAPAAAAGEPTFRDVFTSGKEGYHTFRIPALIVTPGGTLLAFCEGRKTSRSDHGDLDLVLKRSTDGGKTWGPLELVYEEGGTKKITIGNPCPVVDESTGVLWLPFCRDNDDVLVMSSKDEGKTWSKPVDITAAVKKKGWTWYATGPGVGIQLRHGPHKGRLLIPCDHRERAAGGEAKYSHAFYSDDHGKTWQLGENVGLDTNECQAVELADGTVMMNMRNYAPRHKGQRAVALSKDGGRTWGALSYDEALIEPVCQASFLRYTGAGKGKDRILFSNPASKRSRDHLTIRLSYDEGKTWPVARVLHAGPSAYSCLTVLPDRSIGCLYEAGEKSAYETICFARIDLDWLTGGKDALKPKE
jgi:sialidase-1